MSFAKQFGVAVGAAQTGIRINTDEIPDALDVISKVCQEHGWVMHIWDRHRGIISPENMSMKPAAAKKKSGLAGIDSAPEQEPQPTGGIGLAAISAFLKMGPVIDPEDKDDTVPVILVMKNYHLIFEDTRTREETIAAVQHLLNDGKEHSKFLVGLTVPEADIPPEIDPLFHVLDHELPKEEELAEILEEIDVDEDILKKLPKSAVAKAALGLTRLQAEGIYSSFLVQYGTKLKEPTTPAMTQYVSDEKAAILNKEGLVTIEKNNLDFSKVGGLMGFKDFLKRLTGYDPLQDDDPEARARGVTAVGPPGVGKSLMAYCLGNELKMMALKANPGNLMDQYVGNTEKKTRRFFQMIARMAPCIVIMDEVGQTMPSGKDQGNDVGKRMLGTFLTNMNDMTEPVFWFFTSNDVEQLHEAFLREERIDGVIYVRLPGPEQRAQIWSLYLKKFFPEKVKGQPCPRHKVLDIDEVLKTFTKTKKVNVFEWGDRCVAALLTMSGDARDKAVRRIEAVSAELAEIVNKTMIDDEDWTPAEIKACCRKTRRLGKTLAEGAKVIRNVCKGIRGGKILAKLDKWAINEGAIDAETGTQFKDTEEAEEVEAGAVPRKRARRRVRTQD